MQTEAETLRSLHAREMNAADVGRGRDLLRRGLGISYTKDTKLNPKPSTLRSLDTREMLLLI